MGVIKVELNVPKESKEVIDLLAKLFDEARDGLGVDDISKVLPELLAALDGLDQVDEEIKGKDRGAILAYLVNEVGERLL